jgi:hypothetical protein
VSTDIRPVDAPDLQPLRNAFEYDQLEEDMKDVFLTVFDQYIRPFERQVNLSGMPHLGDTELIERTLKDYGLAIVRRDATRTAFLLKAARARNPRRGMLFLKQYLQSVWPGVWKVETLWHPVVTSVDYPEDCTPLTTVQLDPTTVAVFKTDTGEDLPDVYRTDWRGKHKLFSTPRTNRTVSSEDFASTNWSKPNSTVTAAAITAPDGTITGTRFVPTAGSAQHSTTSKSIAYEKGKTYTVGVFARPDTLNGLYLNLSDAVFGTNNSHAAFDLVNKTAITLLPGASAQIVDAANGWLCCLFTATCIADGSTGTTIYAAQKFDGAFANTTYNADGTSGLYIWGGSSIEGEASGYIKTTTAAVTVTDFTVDANGIATFTDGGTPPAPLVYFRTGRIRITLPVSADNGLGLVEIAKAFRSTLAARLMLELQLSTVFESLGQASGGFSLAGGAIGCMPILLEGTLTK